MSSLSNAESLKQENQTINIVFSDKVLLVPKYDQIYSRWHTLFTVEIDCNTSHHVSRSWVQINEVSNFRGNTSMLNFMYPRTVHSIYRHVKPVDLLMHIAQTRKYLLWFLNCAFLVNLYVPNIQIGWNSSDHINDATICVLMYMAII
jgi:hypothetical protein